MAGAIHSRACSPASIHTIGNCGSVDTCKIASTCRYYVRFKLNIRCVLASCTWFTRMFTKLNVHDVHVYACAWCTRMYSKLLNHGWPVNHCFKWFFYLHAEPALRCFLLRLASSTPNHFVWGRRPFHLPCTVEQADWVPVKVPHLEIVTSTLSSLFKNAPSSRFEPGALHMKVHHANHQAMEDCWNGQHQNANSFLTALLASETRGLHAVHVAVFVYICDGPLNCVLPTNSNEGQQTFTDTLLWDQGKRVMRGLRIPRHPSLRK